MLGTSMFGDSTQFVFLAMATVHAAATLYMCGLIWFVQLVHYPLHGLVGPEEFVNYQAEHVRRTSWVVVAPMVVELLAAVFLVIAPLGKPAGLWAVVGLLLLVKVWVSTAFLSVPAHRTLEKGRNPQAHLRLVSTNWVRTVAWTARAPIALMLLIHIVREGNV